MQKESLEKLMQAESQVESPEVKNFINSLLIQQTQMKKDYTEAQVLKMWHRWRDERITPYNTAEAR